MYLITWLCLLVRVSKHASDADFVFSVNVLAGGAGEESKDVMLMRSLLLSNSVVFINALLSEKRILVSIRVRPLSDKEIGKNISELECINDTTIIYRSNVPAPDRSLYPTSYPFDHVFSTDCPTWKVYEESAKEVSLSVLSGFNPSIFAYGQTSSGKTNTMTGITEYAVADFLDYIEEHKEREFVLKFSASEI